LGECSTHLPPPARSAPPRPHNTRLHPPSMFARSFLAAVVAMSAIAQSSAFAPSSGLASMSRRMPLRSTSPRALRRPVHVGGVKMMATMLENGDMKLTAEECEMLKLPPDTVIPPDSVAEIQADLQNIADDEVRKLARQIGLNPEEEPYPGYFEDIERLGLTDANMGTSSVNPASMYGPDGKPYAPWMVGKVMENAPKRERPKQSEDDVNFQWQGRGAELSGAGGGGLNARLLGDEVRLSFQVGDEENSKGYRITKRPGGSEDDAYKLVADYLTPGANLNSGQMNGDYSYVDGETAPGVWVYRVQEEDLDGKRMTLSQTIIEVPSNSDKIKTLVAGGLIVAFLGAFTFLGQSVDPMNGIN